MLKLVVDQKKKVNNCRNSCALFNQKHNSCPIFLQLDYDHPSIITQCQSFTPTNNELWGTDEEDFLALLEMELATTQTYADLDFSLNGDIDHYEEYPQKPSASFDKNMGLQWFQSTDQLYGCWIMNESLKPMALKPSYEATEKGWGEKVYRSPIPLHNHNCSKDLRSRICWYVDQDGWGQYVVLVNNQIGFMTNPKPLSFTR